ncbi:MAG: SoxR reducing system RseC family protein [Candidatus Thiothrix singaporensis]|uniref:SoxR reducing system RseC family protein n=1 Tax=Candidatus Thiothrix singaporensis TaxID=2799669 RepID=A0A7L6APC7_9GAMM|nr:MAG: SoxR reducing system RseC family protein [Candidatus Thiothrix singaporensis]
MRKPPWWSTPPTITSGWRPRRSACSTCGSQSGCSTSSLSKLFGIRQQRIRLPNTFSSRIGEQVVIGVEDRSWCPLRWPPTSCRSC